MKDTQGRESSVSRKVEAKNTHERKTSVSYLDFGALASDRYPCERADSPQAEGMLNAIRLLGAKEAGQILGVSPNVVYALWNERLLDFWSIHGTKKTNLEAIASFLEATRNQELRLGRE